MTSFEDIAVSTQTYVVKTNISSVDLDACYANLYPTLHILMVKYKNRCKGENCVKTRSENKKNFLNCVALSVLSDKKINVKIFNNGVFQMTGCKKPQNVTFCMNVVHAELFRIKASIPEVFNVDEPFRYYVISAMRNVDFDIGFKINRNALGTYISSHTDYSVPPMTSGYMGVKIKIPVESVLDIDISLHDSAGRILSRTSYGEFYASVYPNEKKLKKNHFVSISVFQNGKVLMSGIDVSVQSTCYYWFVNLIGEIKDLVELKKSAVKTFRRF